MANRGLGEYIILGFKGMLMGAADIIPGVSGGTVAFIAGIYEELIASIKNIDLSKLLILKNQGFKSFWTSINGGFLLALLVGIAFSMLSLSRIVSYLLKSHSELLWAFFFGLILASSYFIARNIRKWTLPLVLIFACATIGSYGITLASVQEGSDHGLMIFCSGAVAICAMILPGISGSFILLLLGMYGPMMQALMNLDLFKIVIFLSGCVLGLLAFSRLLSWMFERFGQQTYIMLLGVMIGSLNKVWPWKHNVSFALNRHGEQIPVKQISVLPSQYQELTHQDPQLWGAVVLMLLGILIVVAMDQIPKRFAKKV